MGLDEVGRGCLAGPVVAAGVILNPHYRIEGIADSKKLSGKQRIRMAGLIREHALCHTIAWCDNREIDKINILRASLLAMIRCVEKADPPPDFLLIDGNKGLDSLLIPSQAVIGGDANSISIGAASILAKVYRDSLMHEMHARYPAYGWNRNVGYPTREHYLALQTNGFSPLHRKSFRLRTERPCSPVNDC